MTQSLQLGNPKGRLDILAVRLLECAIKGRYGVPVESTLTVDLMCVGELIAQRVGFPFASLRPHLEAMAEKYGVSTEQTLPELAHSVGLLRGRRAGGKRKYRVNPAKVASCT